MFTGSYDDVGELEEFLNLPPGSLRNIPIYARAPAVDAILKVKELERASLFRPGLYYIVLADLIGNTDFNARFGDQQGDLRIEWFQTAVIQSLGELALTNYVAYSKAIGDAALLIFSSFFADVYAWSNQLSLNLTSLSHHYPLYLDGETDEYEEQIAAFTLRARRLVHLGEVSFKDHADPLSLAVSQTFKAEKAFDETYLGCTQPVADAVAPKLNELGIVVSPNRPITIAGSAHETMTYYLIPRDGMERDR